MLLGVARRNPLQPILNPLLRHPPPPEHDTRAACRGGDIGQGIRFQENQIGVLAYGDGACPVFDPEESGHVPRAGDKCLIRGQPRRDYALEFAVSGEARHVPDLGEHRIRVGGRLPRLAGPG